MKKIIQIIFIILITSTLYAQTNFNDSKQLIPSFKGFYAFHLSGGDMKERFGNNSCVGGGFNIKNRKNFSIGLEVNYIFGGKVKEANLFDAILTTDPEGTDGYIIDGNGQYADIRLYQRGYNPMLHIGKLFPIIGPNINSGIVLRIGGGYMIHKIRIENPDNVTPQIKDDYKKGYDRYSTGWAGYQYIGYSHIGSHRLLSFEIGLEAIQAWTVNRRYNFDLRGFDTRQRLDMLYGIKLSWLIPTMKREPDKFYYN